MILKYILDTCVISEVVKTSPSASVLAWINSQADVDLYLSVITIGEIRKGIEGARAKNPAAALRYESWLDSLVTQFRTRILPFDEPAAQTWGTLMARLPNSGVEDAQIAAMALTLGMTVVTRNVVDFAQFGVPVYNPF